MYQQTRNSRIVSSCPVESLHDKSGGSQFQSNDHKGSNIIKVNVVQLLRTMGETSSTLRHIDNDFELVIRATKALEQRLEKDFDLESDTQLSNKIHCLSGRVESSVLTDMKKLAYWRNQLVHNPSINSLQELGISRLEFNKKFEKVQQYLLEKTQSLKNRSSNNNNNDDGWGNAVGAAALLVGGMAVAMAASSADDFGSVHRGFICDDCGTKPIRGKRYRCQTCRSFDVCQSCWSKQPPSCGHLRFLENDSRLGSARSAQWPN